MARVHGWLGAEEHVCVRLLHSALIGIERVHLGNARIRSLEIVHRVHQERVRDLLRDELHGLILVDLSVIVGRIIELISLINYDCLPEALCRVIHT